MIEASQSAPPAATVRLLGDGVAHDAAAGSLTLPPDPERDKIEAIVTVPAHEGRPRRSFLVSVRELPIDRTVTTEFDAPEALSQLGFLGHAAPVWRAEEGFARMIPASGSRAHGDWAGAGGDGVYRCLLRWSMGDAPYSLDRRLSFGVRVVRVGSTWTGLRVDAYMTQSGASRLQLRDYTGDQGATVVLATVDAAWSYGVWQWLEVAVSGSSVRARIHAEGADAPGWQIVATTASAGPGAFGPGGFPAGGYAPVIDLRTLEFRPNAA